MSNLETPSHSDLLGVGAEEPITDFDRKVWAAMNKSQAFYGKDFKEWIPEWVAQAGVSIPITQVMGFSEFVAQTSASVGTYETTTSDTYDDLATTGPTLTALAPGKYLIFYTCQAKISDATGAANASIEVNATAASDDDVIGVGDALTLATVTGFAAKTLPSASNTVTMKYRRDTAGTATFGQRRLVAFKYDNI